MRKYYICALTALSFGLGYSLALGLEAPPATLNPATAAVGHAFSASQIKLLVKNHYRIRADGSILDPSSQAVQASEIPYLLQRLESAQRLRAFLQIKLILGNSDGEKNLTPLEREQIRGILRENWSVFTWSTRKKFRAYFTLQELEEINQTPPPMVSDELALSDMRDPEPDLSPEPEAPAETPGALAQVAQKPVPNPSLAPRWAPQPRPFLAAPAIASPRIEGSSAAASPAAPPAFAVPAAVAAGPVVAPPPIAPQPPAPADLGVLKPVPSAPAVAAAPPAGTAATVAPVTAAPTAAAGASQDLVAMAAAATVRPPAAAVPPVPPSTTAAAGTSAGTVAPTTPLPPVPETLKGVSHAEFEMFLADAPYSRDIKALLRMISDKAPAFARPRALNALLASLPLISMDSNRAGRSLYGNVVEQTAPSGEKSYVIALNPGAVIAIRKKMFWGKVESLLPDSPDYLAQIHVSDVKVDALRRDGMAAKQEMAEWGMSKFYADDSLRGTFSNQEQGGHLLRQLLLLEAQRQSWDLSPYAAELYARGAQMMFYAKLHNELQDDRFLNPDLRLAYHEWLEHPTEYRDHLVHALASSRGGRLDPKRTSLAQFASFVQGQNACDNAQGQASPAALREALTYDTRALVRARLIDEGQAESARQKIMVDTARAAEKIKPWTGQECLKEHEEVRAGIQRAEGLLNEMLLAEQKFREEQAHE
ncbi:MAG: hypothetical protein HY921_10880 [Elusimicrobia bacterium]|nr:hypothetical protein [Elusimicrobiota bacterium]